MIGPVTSNSLLSSAFGPGALRDLYQAPLSRSQRSDVDHTEPVTSEHSQPVDEVELSTAALQLAGGDVASIGGLSSTTFTRDGAAPETTDGQSTRNAQASTGAKTTTESQSGLAGVGQPAPEEEAEVRELKERDAEVRRHEQAHKSAAGQYASGGASFEFETGPDGRRYAVSGEVQIDTSAVQGDPQATITKMQQIRRAALAPGSPSSQDRSVAAQASKAEQQARAELAEQRRETQETQGGGSGTPTVSGVSQDISHGIEGSDQAFEATANQANPFGAGKSNGNSQAQASMVQAAALASHNTRTASAQSARRGLVDLVA